MTTIARPERSEAAAYYFEYIDQVAPGDIRDVLAEQLKATTGFLRGISEAQSLSRYAPDKWSIREVLNHLSDCERLFTFRAFWFARGFESALPSFDQNVANAAAGADSRSWNELIEEFSNIRLASISFFRSLPVDAWSRSGVASGNPCSVRALAYMVAGHVTHHVSIIRARYL
ncbi:MAG: DinB family protein [Gemmatimonadota bacterium]